MLLRIGSRIARIDVCRGIEGRCRRSVIRSLRLEETIRTLVRRSDSIEPLADDAAGVLPHGQVKIALAACPNACTMPQIKDIGVIARLIPRSAGPACSGCGGCTAACREQAVALADGRPQWNPDACVGCGDCISACPQAIIRAEPPGLDILIGGRMGRRPRWAQLLCTVREPDFEAVLEKLLTFIGGLDGPRRPADIIETNGLTQLRERIFHD